MKAARYVRQILLGTIVAGAVLLFVFAVSPAAQQFVIGYFSRIYLGSASGPAIRYGVADPSGSCAPGSLYLQKASATAGNVWLCRTDSTTGATSGAWSSVGTGGNGEYLFTDYGGVCDGTTDNNAVLNNIATAIALRPDKTGTIVLPASASYCAYSGTWRIGPSTIPAEVATGDAPGINPISITITPPRAATLTFTASSTTIGFTGTDLTSADVGNEVWYGTTDAAYTAFDARTVVPTPSYTCVIASVNTGAHTAVCTPPTTTAYQGTIASAGPVNTLVTMTTASTGSHASFISNDHDFTVVDSNDLTSDHVDKSVQLVLPALRAPLNLLNQTRNGVAQVDTGTQPCSNDGTSGHAASVGLNRGAWSSGTTYATNDRVQNDGYQWISRVGSNLGNTPPTYPTLLNTQWYFQDSFLCQNGGNLKLKQYAAHITAVTDSKHGTFAIDALVTGNSNWVGAFNEAGHTTESNSGAYNAHEWCHGLSATACYFSSSPHLDHTIDFDAFTTPYKASASSSSVALSEGVIIFPYFQPLDTSTVHISVRGAGPYSTTLKWLGPGSEPVGGAIVALFLSRDKEFQMSGFTLFNAETCGSGACYDTHSRIGMLFGGLPGFGTQTFGFVGTQLAVTGFDNCVLMGDNLGGETSDESFNELAVSYCNYGLRMAPGSYNTLDVKAFNMLGGFNKYAVENNDGNLIVQNGSFSYNDVDFHSNGFGPFIIAGFRSEGPGRFFLGDEPGVSIRDVNIAEPQGARPTTGTVTCTPTDVRSVTVDVGADTGGPPTNTFFPLTFGAGDILAEDSGKTIVVELTGGDLVGYVNSVSSTTDGQMVRQYGTAAVESGKTAYIYDTDKCALTWSVANQATANDVGGAFMLPNADTHSDYSSLTKVYIDSVESTTTGTGHWVVGQGGPVVHAGSSDVDPVLFDNIVIEFTNSGYPSTVDNLLASGLVTVRGGSGSLRLSNSLVATAPIGSSDALPVRMEQPGKAWRISEDVTGFPTPHNNTGHSTGIQFPGSLVDTTNSYSDGVFRLTATANQGNLHVGANWQLQDIVGQWVRGGFNAFIKQPVSPVGSGLGHNYYDNHPFDPAQPASPLGWVTSLSSAVLSNSRNLVVWGTFTAPGAGTLNLTFKRSETLDFTYASGTHYVAATRVATFEVGSGHFTVDDIGRSICYDNTSTDFGTRNVCGWVSSIVDATHITVTAAVGQLGIVQGTSDFSVTATVGDDEPDTRYRVWPSCDVPEAIGITSIGTTGFTATSSNALSTANCRFFIVHY